MPFTPECDILGFISQLRLSRFFHPPTAFTTQAALGQHSQETPDPLVPSHQSGPLPQLDDAACRNVVVAVVGPVGCGKSTFINHLVNEDVVVGYSDGPCTRDITAYKFMYDQGTQVHLIDSPGFNGATITNTMVLEKIAAFLKHSQSPSMTLDGVVLLHRYSDRRTLGSKLLSIERVRDLVDSLADGNGVFAVITWHDIAQRGGSGEERNRRVGQVVRDGYGVVRVRNTERSATELMKDFLARSKGFPMAPLASHSQSSSSRSLLESALAEVQPPPSLAPPETTDSLFISGSELVNTVRPIRENFLTARRLAPELFRCRQLDWIEVTINGAKTRAVICTANQASVISQRSARLLSIDCVIDYRFAGRLRGPTHATIIGRIHHTILQIGGRSFPVALTVLEDSLKNDGQKSVFFLGLDFMRKHDAVVDYSRNVTVIDGMEGLLV